MTDDEKILALAEAHDWKLVPSHDSAFGNAVPECWVHDDYEPAWDSSQLPNYLGDLNAMRELIMALPIEGKVSQKAMRFWMWEVAGQMAVLPSAREYADGFLMMIGKLEPQTKQVKT